MDNPTYPVTRKLIDNRESLSFHLALDGPANSINRLVCTSDDRCLFERQTCASAQSRGFLGTWRNGNGNSRVCNVAIQFGGDIQAYKVTLFEHSVTGNPVHDLIVDADEINAWETVLSTCSPARSTSAVVTPARTACIIAFSVAATPPCPRNLQGILWSRVTPSKEWQFSILTSAN